MKLTQTFAAVALAVTAAAQVVAQAGDAPAASATVIDAELPAGNVVVEKIEGDTVCLHQDLRDSSQDWFYWKFRVRGAAGRTLRFRFTKSAAVGSRGPAVSTDRGKTWVWGDDLQPSPRREPKTNDHGDWQSFVWEFGEKDDEVWFSQAIPYDASDWRAFGRDIAAGYREHLEPSGGPERVDGIYPHLAMQNGEGECDADSRAKRDSRRPRRLRFPERRVGRAVGPDVGALPNNREEGNSGSRLDVQ